MYFAILVGVIVLVCYVAKPASDFETVSLSVTEPKFFLAEEVTIMLDSFCPTLHGLLL